MEPPTKDIKKIGIAGLGLIGGSISLELQELGHTIYGLVNSTSNLERAKARGLTQFVDTDPKILSNCQIVILALPISQLINPSQELVNALSTDSVVTDVGSVKAPVLNVWEKLHPNFVASHPMAGTTQAGIEAGQTGLFKGRPWVATPTNNTNPEALEVIHKLVMSLGSQWITANAEEHDQAVAMISHLPVIISAALLKAAGKASDQSDTSLAKILCSSGFADTTRVGGGNPNLGVDMASYNTKPILDVLHKYRVSLRKLEEIINTSKWDKLKEELEDSQRIRSDFLL